MAAHLMRRFDMVTKLSLLPKAVMLATNMKEKGVPLGTERVLKLLALANRTEKYPVTLKVFEVFGSSQDIAKDTRIYSAVILAASNLGSYSLVLEYLNQAEAAGVRLDNIAYGSVFKACPDATTALDHIDGLMAKDLFFPDLMSCNHVISLAVKEGSEKVVARMFSIMNQLNVAPDVYTYTTVLSLYCKLDRYDAVEATWNDMISRGITPSVVTFNVMLSNSNENAPAIIKLMQSHGFKPDNFTYNSLLQQCVAKGEVDRAIGIFNQLLSNEDLEPNAVNFTTVLDLCTKHNRLPKAFDYLRELIHIMGVGRFKPDNAMFQKVINVCTRGGYFEMGERFVSKMLKRDIDTGAYNSILALFAKQDRLDDAINVFKILTQTPDISPNANSYIIMWRLCDKLGRYDERGVFERAMQEKGFEAPNSRLASPSKGNCPDCGLVHKNEGFCPASKAKCDRCGKPGHYRAMCKQRSGSTDIIG